MYYDANLLYILKNHARNSITTDNIKKIKEKCFNGDNKAVHLPTGRIVSGDKPETYAYRMSKHGFVCALNTEQFDISSNDDQTFLEFVNWYDTYACLDIGSFKKIVPLRKRSHEDDTCGASKRKRVYYSENDEDDSEMSDDTYESSFIDDTDQDQEMRDMKDDGDYIQDEESDSESSFTDDTDQDQEMRDMKDNDDYIQDEESDSESSFTDDTDQDQEMRDMKDNDNESDSDVTATDDKCDTTKHNNLSCHIFSHEW